MKVLLTEPIHPNGVKLLKDVADVVQAPAADHDSIQKAIADCDAVLIRSAKITADIIESAPKLKCIAKHGIGVDNIDIPTASSKGIKVVNAPFSNLNAVAEHTLSLVLSMLKEIPQLDSQIRAGNYVSARKGATLGELSGKTVCFIGIGRIAQRVLELLAPFHCDVHAYDPFAPDTLFSQLGIQRETTLDALLPLADVLLIHVPLTPETKGLINEKTLAQMKPTAMVVNTARGGIVDEAALLNALRGGELGAAATDVFEAEPPKADTPIINNTKVVLSPHCAALTAEALEAMATQSAAGVCSVLRNETPEFFVNRDAF